MAAAAILNFKNCNFWSRDCNRVQYLMQCTKFHKNRTIFHSDMAIERFTLQLLSCSPCRPAVLLPHTKFRWNRTISRRVISKKANFKMEAAAILNFKNFNFWSHDCNRVQYISKVVYQISSKLDDISLRYGDLTIFKMAAVHHVGFFL